MPISYVTAGPWGAGTGVPHTAAEADAIIYDLAQQIEALETDIDGGAAVSIDSITQDGSNLNVILTDASVQGPFAMPRPPQRPTTTKEVSADVYTVIVGDSMALLRCIHSSGCEVIIDDIDLPVDAEFNVWCDSDNPVTFTAGSGVFFVPPPEGKMNAINVRGHSVTCKKVSEDSTAGAEWYIFGGLGIDGTA